jgi:hypothetical protein
VSIVEGEDYKMDLGREQAKPVGRRAGDKPGLRVKKIFRKEGNESSDRNVPTVLVYNNSAVKGTYVGLQEFSGRKCTPECKLRPQTSF